MDREEAIQRARELTRETGRKHVARNDYGRFFVCPFYIDDFYKKVDFGYSALGLLVRESLREDC